MEQDPAGGSSADLPSRLRRVHGATPGDAGSPWWNGDDGDGETCEGVPGATVESVQQCGKYSESG